MQFKLVKVTPRSEVVSLSRPWGGEKVRGREGGKSAPSCRGVMVATDEVPEACPGVESENAGKMSACAGCPNQANCASGEAAKPDPAIEQIKQRLEVGSHRQMCNPAHLIIWPDLDCFRGARGRNKEEMQSRAHSRCCGCEGDYFVLSVCV